MCGKARLIMATKNRDYGSNEDADPFANFHIAGELGIIVRASDKVSRLLTYAKRGSLATKDESVEDTALDLLNYSVLLLGYLHNKKC